MRLNFFKKKTSSSNLKEEWNNLGAKYAKAINEMVTFAEEHGWDKWTGEEAEDGREYLADDIFKLLKEANATGKVEEFRADFPPSHSPLTKFLDEKAQNIDHISFIENDKVVFLTGSAYEKRQAYILDGMEVKKLESSIDAVGKSKRGNVFAVLKGDQIVTTQGWQGDIIHTFELTNTNGLGVTELIPFNDGQKVMSVTSEGIFIISPESEKLIHPNHEEEEDEEDWGPDIDMENATLSNDNNFIVVGDQCSSHRVLDDDGQEVGTIGQQSEYPHFCLFSADDKQLITNSCHFYNGITIGVPTSKLNGIAIEEYDDNGDFITIDEEMRVYVGLAMQDFYILGDAYGYIKGLDKSGKQLWRHFLGSTISSISLSDDESTLFVGTYGGILHKLRLNRGCRDTHTIGNSNLFEEFRLLLWKGEPVLRW